MVKINSKEFYSRHSNEIQRYLTGKENVLNVFTSHFHIEDDLNNINNLKINLNDPLLETFEKLEDNYYDLIILTDVFELSQDIYQILKSLKSKLNINGKILITSINPLWDRIIKLFEILNLKDSSIERSYIKTKKLNYICNGLGLETINSYSRQFFPFKFFGMGRLINSILEIIFSRFKLGIKHYSILGDYSKINKVLKKTVIIPAKNEEDNLIILFERLQAMHLEAEYILVCAKSQDNTREVALKLIKQYPKMDIVYVEQKSNGKANGVFEGITFAKGDVLAILDSDISVDPEKLFDFFEIIENNSADFVNGTRMIYPMEKKAMRFLNKIGNKTFQYIISKVIFQDLSDSLCGTKVFKKTNIESLLSWRYNQKVIDPFADFDLIFSSAYHGLKIAELPVHYKARVYGTTQISRFRDGYKLLVYFLYSFYLFNVSKYSK